jgi:hypothetical protein
LVEQSSFAVRHSLAIRRFYSSVYQIQATNKIHARGQYLLRTHLVFVHGCHMHGTTAISHAATGRSDASVLALDRIEIRSNQRTTTNSAIKETFSFVRTDVVE